MFTPYVGTTYKFTFQAPFNQYDGIYHVLRIMTFDEVVADNVNLLKLYTNVSKTEDDFNEDINTIRADRILKLINVEDETDILYIPMFLGLYEPDPNVKQYSSLAVALYLGVFDDVNELNAIKETLEATVAKKYGVPDSAAVFSIEEKWMTEAEYDQHVAERALNSNQLVNLYSEVHRLRRELESANTKIRYYEDKLIYMMQNGGLVREVPKIKYAVKDKNGNYVFEEPNITIPASLNYDIDIESNEESESE